MFNFCLEVVQSDYSAIPLNILKRRQSISRYVHKEAVEAFPTRVFAIMSGKLDNKLIVSLLFNARCYQCEIVKHFSMKPVK